MKRSPCSEVVFVLTGGAPRRGAGGRQKTGTEPQSKGQTMFTRPATDPTEGERARRIRERPDLAQPIVDPTDPRVPGRARRRASRRASAPPAGLETSAPARES